jgi:hypothetical protein
VGNKTEMLMDKWGMGAGTKKEISDVT